MWWILRWNFWACKQRVSGGEKISARFSPPTTTVQWDPTKITLNFAISKFVSRRHKIPWQFCLRAFVAANFASHIFRREFRRQFFFAGADFSPAPIFRRRRFSPAPFFAALSLHAALKHTNSALLPPFQKQSKQPQPTCTCPIVTGEKAHFYSLIITITIAIACQPPTL